MEIQYWENPTCSSGAAKHSCTVVFHEHATTASNKPGTHRVEWPLSINTLSWQRLHFPWEDSFFQTLGSIDPGQHMTNSAAVSHNGCVSLTTQQKQPDCQETLSENNFISFHLPSNQFLEKLICFAAISRADLSKLLEQTVGTGSALGWDSVDVRVGCWAQSGLPAWAGSAANQTGTIQLKSHLVRWRQWLRKNQRYWTCIAFYLLFLFRVRIECTRDKILCLDSDVY